MTTFFQNPSELGGVISAHFSKEYLIHDTYVSDLDPGEYKGVNVGRICCIDFPQRNVGRYYIELDFEGRRVKVGFSRYALDLGEPFVIYSLVTFNVIRFKGINHAFLQIENPVYFLYNKKLNKIYGLSLYKGGIVRHSNSRYLCLVEEVTWDESYIYLELRTTLGFKYKKDIAINLSYRKMFLDNFNRIEIKELIQFYINPEYFECLPKSPKNYPLQFKPIKEHEIFNSPFEIWSDIKGYETLYSISNYGRIKSYFYEGFVGNEGFISVTSWEGVRLYNEGVKEYFDIEDLMEHIKFNFEQSPIAKKLDFRTSNEEFDKVVYRIGGIWAFWCRCNNELSLCCFLKEEYARVGITNLIKKGAVVREEQAKVSEKGCYLLLKL